MSETRFLIDFRQTTDLKNATRYEQKIKKGKREKKQLKSQAAKKRRKIRFATTSAATSTENVKRAQKKKKHDVDVDDASSDVAASSDCVHVCLLCATSRWLCGEGALPASTATTTATATLTLLTWTWTWRLTGVFGASWARFMAAFCCCFFSLPASLLFSFRFFFARFLARGFKIKSVYCVGGRSLCVCVWVSLIGFGAMYVLRMPGRGEWDRVVWRGQGR